MDKIESLSVAIAETSSAYNVPKAVISAILAREITCYIPGEDFIGGSVGVAQINPETVLSSFRSYYNEEYGFTAQQIEDALKNDDSYSVNMCGLIIANIAREQNVDLYNCSKEELEGVIARYNGYGDSAAQYGRETYVYYEAYDVYYNS